MYNWLKNNRLQCISIVIISLNIFPNIYSLKLKMQFLVLVFLLKCEILFKITGTCNSLSHYDF